MSRLRQQTADDDDCDEADGLTKHVYDVSSTLCPHVKVVNTTQPSCNCVTLRSGKDH